LSVLNGMKVLIAEPIHGSEYTYGYLREVGCELIIGPHVSRPKEAYSEDQLVELGNEVDAFIGMSREKMTKRVIQNSKRLRIITKTGIGVDHIDVATATECGILVTNSPMNRLSVAEYAIGYMIALLKKMIVCDKHLKAGGWRGDHVTGFELYGKTVGILGFGGIGRQVAKRLQGWDVTMIAHDPYIDPVAGEKFGVKLVSRDPLFKEADILTLHLPLSSETKASVGTAEFMMMKPGAILINTARGKIVIEADLIEALRNHKIAGAGVDVFETEPVNLANPLLSMENVITSPHGAGFTFEALARMAEQSARNTVKALSGEVPDAEFIVNPEALEAWKSRWLK
jgi:D-3-phosphoglycerate dehydrogenase / 2-oxoglutarate reductase